MSLNKLYQNLESEGLDKGPSLTNGDRFNEQLKAFGNDLDDVMDYQYEYDYQVGDEVRLLKIPYNAQFPGACRLIVNGYYKIDEIENGQYLLTDGTYKYWCDNGDFEYSY